MSIASEITRIKINIANAYSKCEEKGATIPSVKNSANLASTIGSITGGGGGGGGEGLKPIAIVSPYADADGKFVKPEEWDDIESIPVAEDEQVLYLLYDNTIYFSWCSITVTCNTGSSICDYGRVVNGQFQVLATETKASKQNYQKCFTTDFPDEDYIVLRIRPASTNNLTVIGKVNWTYNGRALDHMYQPILMRYGSLPKATSISLNTYTLISDNILNFQSITSLANYCQTCYQLVRHRHTNWNTDNVTTAQNMLQDCWALSDMDTDFSGWFTTGKITALQAMFRSLRCISELNVTGWNTTNVTAITDLFFESRNLKRIIGVEGWYLPKCVSSGSTPRPFNDCRMLEQDNGKLDLSNWHFGEQTTSNQAYVGWFQNTAKLREIDISTFNLSNCTTMSAMFDSVMSLKKIHLPENIGSGEKLTNYGNIFNNCHYIEEIDFSTLNASKITSSYEPFPKCYNLKKFYPPALLNANITLSTNNMLSHDSLVAVLNSLATLTSAKTLTIGKINLSKLSDDEIAIATNKGWTLA